jgi:hypothetical protein
MIEWKQMKYELGQPVELEIDLRLDIAGTLDEDNPVATQSNSMLISLWCTLADHLKWGLIRAFDRNEK